MTDNTDTLEDVLKEYNCDEFECWCADKPELIQALNLYIEEKEKKTKLNMVNELLELSPRARYNRLAEMQTDLITDEDIKKGWPKV